jgi:peptide/nickel transport system substrate-binding protein
MRRVSRRAGLRLIGATGGGLGAAMLAACGGGGQERSATENAPAMSGTVQASTNEPKQGGTLHLNGVPSPATYGSMDPHATIWTTTFTAPVGNGLLKRNMFPPPKYEIVNDLATNREQPDELTYRFSLAPGVKFHSIAPVNGREMTAEDVKYSLERIRTDDPKFFRKAEFRGVTVETPDRNTVILKTDAPIAGMLDRLATWGTFIFPKEFVETVEGGLIKSGKPVPGTGPLMHVEWVLDQSLKFRRNPEYWRKPKPYLVAIEYTHITDVTARIAAFKAKQLDVIAGLFNPQLEEVRKEIPDAVTLRQEGFQTHRVVFNLRQQPWNDVRVRKAVHLALNRQQIIQAGWFGVEAVPTGWGGINPTAHPGAAYSQDELAQLPGYRKDKTEDLQQAKQLMQAAGVSNLKADMPYSTFADTPQEHVHAQVVQQNLRAIGIDVTLVPKPYADSLVLLTTNNWGIYDTRQWATSVDPNEYLLQYQGKDGPRNYGKWDHPRYNELLAQQGQITDQTRRARTIREMLKILEEEVPMAWTINWLLNLSLHKHVQGMGIGVSFSSEYDPEGIWLDT